MLNATKSMMMVAVAANVAGVMGLVYPEPLADGTVEAKTAVVDGRVSTPLPATGEDDADEALVFALPEYVMLCGTAAAVVSLPWANVYRRARRVIG